MNPSQPAIFAVGTRVVTIADVRGRNGLVEVLRGALGTVLRPHGRAALVLGAPRRRG